MIIYPSKSFFINYIAEETNLQFTKPAMRWIYDYIEEHRQNWAFDEEDLSEDYKEYTEIDLVDKYGDYLISIDPYKDDDNNYDCAEVADAIFKELVMLDYTIERLPNDNYIIVED